MLWTCVRSLKMARTYRWGGRGKKIAGKVEKIRRKKIARRQKKREIIKKRKKSYWYIIRKNQRKLRKIKISLDGNSIKKIIIFIWIVIKKIWN